MIDDAIVDALDEPLVFVREVLTNLAARAVELRAVGRFGAQHIADMSQALEPECARVFSPGHPEIVGAGIAWEAAETGTDVPGMLWWRADEGVVAPKMHVYNPESDSYYDYAHSEWYSAARESDGLSIVGPFIDAWGTDDHTMTPSLAIVDAAGEIIGAAAADLDVAVITGQLARILRPHPELVLADMEDRVVASNYPLLSPGLRLSPFLDRAGFGVVERARMRVSGWQLLRLERV